MFNMQVSLLIPPTEASLPSMRQVCLLEVRTRQELSTHHRVGAAGQCAALQAVLRVPGGEVAQEQGDTRVPPTEGPLSQIIAIELF